MMIVLKTAGARVRQLQKRMLRSHSESDLTEVRVSIRRAASRAGLRRLSTNHITCHRLYLFSYRTQTLQFVSVAAINTSETFANAMLQQLDAGEIAMGTLDSSKKSIFPLDSFINKPNWQIQGTENPYFAISPSLNPPKVMFGPPLLLTGINGPFSDAKRLPQRSISGHSARICGYTQCLARSWEHLLVHARRCRFLPHRTPEVFHFLNKHSDNHVITLDYCKYTRSGMNYLPIHHI